MKDPIKEIEERLKRGYISNGLTMMVYNQEQIWEDMANLLKLVDEYEGWVHDALGTDGSKEIKKKIFGDK